MTRLGEKSLQSHFLSNRIWYAVVLVLMFGGIILGSVIGAKSGSYSGDTEYIESIFSVFKLQNINHSELFMKSVLPILRNIFLIWLSGFFILLIPLNFIVIASKGFAIGYTISFFVSTKGVLGGIFVFAALFFQYTILLPALLVYSVIQLNFALNLHSIKNSSAHYKQRRHLIFKNIWPLAAMSGIAMLCGYIETYIVPSAARFIL